MLRSLPVRLHLACALGLLAAPLASVAWGCSSFSSDGSDTSDVPEGGADDSSLDAAPDAAPREAGSLHVVYARSFGGSTSDASTDGDGGAVVAPNGIAVDPSGGVTLAGSYEHGSVDIDGVMLAPPSGTDAFLVQLDGMGKHVFSGRYGDTGEQYGVATAGTNAIRAVSFIFQPTVVLAPNKTETGSGGTPYSSAVALYGAGLGYQRHVRFASSFGSALIKHVSQGAAGAFIALGDWQSDLFFDNGPTPFSRTKPGTGLVVARLFALSQPNIARDYCAEGSCIAGALATNVAGDSLVGGRFTGRLAEVDGGAALNAVDDDAYVTKLDTELEPKWVIALGGVGSQEVLAAASIPGTPDFVIAGKFDGQLSAPGRPTATSKGNIDIFLARIDAAGKVVWAETFGGTGDDVVHAVVVDDKGNIFMTGAFTSPRLDLGGGDLVNADAFGLGTSDVFVGWLEAERGAHVYSARFGDGQRDSATALGIDGSGNIVITGGFERTIDFGSGALHATGSIDTYVVKLAR